jgi:hypothetical protein
MASPNVDKLLLTLQKNHVLAVELELVFTKIEAAAEVELTKEEKKEFLKELGDTSKEKITLTWD